MDVDESPRDGERPEALAGRLARAKAEAALHELEAAGPREAGPTAPLVLAADTVVVVEGRAVGKPRDAAENRAFLRSLSGSEHRVITGHELRRGDRREARTVETRVFMRALQDDEIERYVASGEGADKAGGYALQGRGAALVPRIDGCWSNVVGLSLPAVVACAARLGVPLV